MDARARGVVYVADVHDGDLLVLSDAVEFDANLREVRVAPVHDGLPHGEVVRDAVVGVPHGLSDRLPGDVVVDDDIFLLRGDVDLGDLQFRVQPVQGAEQEMLRGVPHHEVVAAIPVDAAPDPLAWFELVARDGVDDLLPLVVDVGDPDPVYGAGIANLPASAGVEPRAIQYHVVASGRNDARLEFGEVAVVPEDFVCHGTCHPPYRYFVFAEADGSRHGVQSAVRRRSSLSDI